MPLSLLFLGSVRPS